MERANKSEGGKKYTRETELREPTVMRNEKERKVPTTKGKIKSGETERPVREALKGPVKQYLL